MKNARINLDFNLIQNIRLLQSMLEISNNISFDSKYCYIFDYLKDRFKTSYVLNAPQKDDLQLDIHIEHSEPSICFGSKKYILVYPKEMLIKLKSQWAKDRNSTTFNGLLTKDRLKFIDEIITHKDKKLKVLKFKFLCNSILTLPKKFVSYFSYNISFQIEELKIRFTNYGRKLPEKSWDDKYYETLLNSKFVLCPDGDFTWTYRFFESIICGAIPVIENNCVAYAGFNYLTHEQYSNNATLTDDEIIDNYNKLFNEFTLDSDDFITYLREICDKSIK